MVQQGSEFVLKIPDSFYKLQNLLHVSYPMFCSNKTGLYGFQKVVLEFLPVPLRCNVADQK